MPLSDATSPSTSQLSAGQLVASRYELLSRLGEGGMGVVYEAYDRLTGSRVALKRVPLETIWSSMMTARGTQIGKATDSTTVRGMRAALASEFHTLASLRHPNIISVLDYGFDNQHTPFFTMELLPAPKTLVAAGAGLALEAQIDLIVQLLRALAYLHRHLIVHRDLKPSDGVVSCSRRRRGYANGLRTGAPGPANVVHGKYRA